MEIIPDTPDTTVESVGRPSLDQAPSSYIVEDISLQEDDDLKKLGCPSRNQTPSEVESWMEPIPQVPDSSEKLERGMLSCPLPFDQLNHIITNLTLLLSRQIKAHFNLCEDFEWASSSSWH